MRTLFILINCFLYVLFVYYWRGCILNRSSLLSLRLLNNRTWHSTIFALSSSNVWKMGNELSTSLTLIEEGFVSQLIISLHSALRSLCISVAYNAHFTPQLTFGWNCLIHKHYFLGFNELNSRDGGLFWQDRSVNLKAPRFRILFPVLRTSLILRHLKKSSGWFLFTFR